MLLHVVARDPASLDWCHMAKFPNSAWPATRRRKSAREAADEGKTHRRPGKKRNPWKSYWQGYLSAPCSIFDRRQKLIKRKLRVWLERSFVISPSPPSFFLHLPIFPFALPRRRPATAGRRRAPLPLSSSSFILHASSIRLQSINIQRRPLFCRTDS